MAGPDFTAQNGLNQVVRYSITNGIAAEAALCVDSLRRESVCERARLCLSPGLTPVTCPRVRDRRTGRGGWRNSKLRPPGLGK